MDPSEKNNSALHSSEGSDVRLRNLSGPQKTISTNVSANAATTPIKSRDSGAYHWQMIPAESASTGRNMGVRYQ
jgi:hypothetical protein